MAIRLRSTLKQWFKRGKYPLEEQFADWIDSFLHKTEDKLPLANVEGLPEQLNAKYDHASGVALEDKHDTLRTEFNRHTATSAVEFKRISDDINDLQATDERQQGEINTANANLEYLRKRLHPTAVFDSLESTFSALGAGYSTLWALADTLKTFLEAKDTADSTINRWREIETFLQGVTDTETLSGLLEQLENDITTAYNGAISAERSRAENQEAAIRGEFAAADKTTVETAKDYTDTREMAIRSNMTAADSSTLDAAKEYADNKIAGLVNSAPGTLDTLYELAEALGNDPDFAATVAKQIGGKADRTELPGAITEQEIESIFN